MRKQAAATRLGQSRCGPLSGNYCRPSPASLTHILNWFGILLIPGAKTASFTVAPQPSPGELTCSRNKQRSVSRAGVHPPLRNCCRARFLTHIHFFLLSARSEFPRLHIDFLIAICTLPGCRLHRLHILKVVADRSATSGLQVAHFS